ALTILDERLDQAARWCLSALVPMIQRSIVDFQQDPTAANNVILDAADTLDGSSPLGDEGAREAVIQMGTLGIVGNGGDTTVGNFDLDRVDEVILHLHDEMPTMAGPVGLSADELVTNEFIDDDIGL
ncbi:MAG: ABC transporter substrate-binding protein, partial [Acidimicrobiia bacterium]|nr:ABC transporter substrate-binding protein [Acidimicrobiia bacterium]